jgi:Ca2+-binding EF-hand superfamily protein
MKKYKRPLQILALSCIFAASGLHGQVRTNAAEEQAGKEWLAAMNQDKDATIDKKEFLDYMTKEFDLADVDHDGTLDVHELGTLRTKFSIAASQGQTVANPAQERAGKEWLAAMNKDKDSTIDKREFLDYMSKEFDLADVDHDGTLDVRELGALRERFSIRTGKD